MKRTRVTIDTTGPPLGRRVLLILLSGWTARSGDPEADRAPDAFDLFIGGDPEVARVWRRHEAFLLGEAVRLDIAPDYVLADGRALYFGQFCCQPRAVQHAYWLKRSAEAVVVFEADVEADGPVTIENTP